MISSVAEIRTDAAITDGIGLIPLLACCSTLPETGKAPALTFLVLFLLSSSTYPPSQACHHCHTSGKSLLSSPASPFSDPYTFQGEGTQTHPSQQARWMQGLNLALINLIFYLPLFLIGNIEAETTSLQIHLAKGGETKPGNPLVRTALRRVMQSRLPWKRRYFIYLYTKGKKSCVCVCTGFCLSQNGPTTHLIS